MSAALPRIALTAGEPAGVGPELVAALAATDLQADLIAIADAGLLRRAAQQRGVNLQLEIFDGSPRDQRAPGALRCVDIPLAVPAIAGKLDAGNARYVLDTLARAADGCVSSGVSRPSIVEFDAI